MLNVPHRFKLDTCKSISILLVLPTIPPLQPQPTHNIYTSIAIPYSFQGNNLHIFWIQKHLWTLISGCSPSHLMLGSRGISEPLWFLMSSPPFLLNSCRCSLRFTIDSLHCYQNYLREKKKSIWFCQFALKPLLTSFCLQHKFQSPWYATQGPWQLAQPFL